jgi:hypothetical protein
MKERYVLNNIVIKNPSTPVEIEWYKITKSNRLANGDMSMDYIATKRKFIFSYEYLSQDQLKPFKDLMKSTKSFFPFEYNDGGNEVGTATVYPGSLKYKKLRSGSYWWYKDITISLVEK